MYKKLNSRYANSCCKLPSLMNSTEKEENLKLVKKWIYDNSKIPNKNVNINFKSQKAFYGYRKNKVDLYKSFNYLIFIY